MVKGSHGFPRAVPGDGQFDVNDLLAFPRVEPRTFVPFFHTPFIYHPRQAGVSQDGGLKALLEVTRLARVLGKEKP